MQRQGGGGNDPSCGCDMQAGWPPASQFPRGGVQGGGAINSFNLALTNNEGKVTHYKGKRNNGMASAPTTVAGLLNLNTNANGNRNNNSNMNLNTNANGNGNNNMNLNNNNTNMNMNLNTNANSNNNINMNLNNNANNNNTNANATINAMLSESNAEVAPPKSSMEKIVFKGKKYYKQKNTGNAYTRNKNGKQGPYVGRFVENTNGKMNLDSSLPASGAPPSQEVDIETEGVGPETGRKTLSQNGGGGSDPVCGSCPFPGTGACPFYARGGGCGCGMRQTGGGCPCSAGLLRGGYRATRKNLKALKKWKQGKSIGFTMTASLKAKGLIPRTSRKMRGKKVVSRKYR